MSKPTTLKEYNQTWYMKTKAGALYRKLSGQITTACDMVKDFKICGKSLTKYVASVDRKVLQATGSESARYWALDEVFKDMKFNKDDKFIDVGCGKGRILAEMERIKFPGQLYGIELNPDVAKYAQDWANRYDNLTIMSGDAFKLDYNDYNIIMLCRPFLKEMYVTFLEKWKKTSSTLSQLSFMLTTIWQNMSKISHNGQCTSKKLCSKKVCSLIAITLLDIQFGHTTQQNNQFHHTKHCAKYSKAIY